MGSNHRDRNIRTLESGLLLFYEYEVGTPSAILLKVSVCCGGRSKLLQVTRAETKSCDFLDKDRVFIHSVARIQ